MKQLLLGFSERNQQMLTGLIAVIVAIAAVFVGIKISSGALDPKYQVNATFTAAGQGLQSGSDVKIHGVDVGKVKSVRLVDGRARVRMEIMADEKIPVDSMATIRPKTLFGEKFVDVDPGAAETSGPFVHDEGEIKHTLGGFELEKVLTDAYPILKAVKPEDLVVVLDTLANGGDGEGGAINRQLVNWQKLADLQVAHEADTVEFLQDLASVSDELDQRAGDLVAGARDLNDVLPALNARGDELGTALTQLSRLSADASDLLENNRSFMEKAVTEGGKTLQTVYDRRGQIGPLIVGVREYLQVQAEVIRIPFGDGTLLAAVKFIAGEDCQAGRVAGACASPAAPVPPVGPPPSLPGGGPPPATPPVTVPNVPLPTLPSIPLPGSVSGAKAVASLLSGAVG